MKIYNIMVKIYLSGDLQIRIYPENIRSDFRLTEEKGKRIYTNVSEAQYAALRSLKNSLARTKNTIYDLARENCNDFMFFVTLTFNPEKVDSFDYSIVTKKLSTWLSNLKKQFPGIKYIGVPEKHKSGRYHFHFLMSDISPILEESGHFTMNGNIIYNLKKYRLGFSTATEVTEPERCCTYICKYLTKDLWCATKNKKHYWRTRNLFLPKVKNFLIDKSQMEVLKNNFSASADYHKEIEYISKAGEYKKIDLYEFHK